MAVFIHCKLDTLSDIYTLFRNSLMGKDACIHVTPICCQGRGRVPER
jgi:hypothetical protein